MYLLFSENEIFLLLYRDKYTFLSIHSSTMCDRQEFNVSQWKVDLVSKYFNPEKDAGTGEGALQEAEEVAETPTRSPRSLKTMAAAMIHNDSGYEGLEYSTGRKSLRKDGDYEMAKEKEENDVSTSSSPILNAETVAEMFNRRDECEDLLIRMVEMAAFLLVIFSVILSVFMGSGDQSQLGGKRAAIQFYYDSLELQREGV